MRRSCSADELCTFCAQYVLGTKANSWSLWGERHGQSSDILWETETLLLIAGLGALTEGYVLLLPKAHYLSIGSMPQEELAEFVSVQACVRSLLKCTYGEIIFFEHGMSSRNRAGGCVEHAHLHGCPSTADFRPFLRQHLEERPIHGFGDLRVLAQEDMPYLFYEDQAGSRFVYPVTEFLPSQFFRKLWAVSVGKAAEWDWAASMGEENVARTIERLRAVLSGKTFPNDFVGS